MEALPVFFGVEGVVLPLFFKILMFILYGFILSLMIGSLFIGDKK